MPEKPLKLQRPYPDEKARTNLLDFVEAYDRDPPPIFVGREEIIERITRDVARCRSNRDGDRCFTFVIHGAPGAGKTSLLSEVQQRLNGGMIDDRRIDDAVVVAKLSGALLSSAGIVANTMIRAYGGRQLDIQKERTSTSTGKAELAGIGGSRQNTIREKGLQEQIRDSGQLWQSVIANTSINIEETVFLLLIDEAQNIEGSYPNDQLGKNSIASALHDGLVSTGGLKIVTVFAGLSDTVSVLAKRGISRIRGSSIQLGELTQAETQDLVTHWMSYDQFGFEDLFTTVDINRVSKMITVASEGWPRHVNTYLRELGRSVLNQRISDDMKIDLHEVFERGHDDRLTYYGDRMIAAELGKYREVIRDAARQSADGVVTQESLAAIAKGKYELSESKYEILHKNAIHGGILEQVSAQNYKQFKFPIPSLLTYMRCDGKEIEFKSKMREHMEAHAYLWSGSNGLTR